MKKIKTALAAALFSLQFFCGFAELNYIEIDSISNAPIVKVKSLNDFEGLISKNNVSTALLQTSASVLFINIGQTYFSFPLNYYTNISDYKTGESLGFKNGNEYYEAKKLELPTSELYYYYKQNSFKSSADSIDANKNNFPNSSDYYASKSLGYDKYSDYKDYLEWTEKNFKSKDDWENAKKKGFSNSQQFYDSEANGFANATDYQTARNLGFTKNEDYKTYNVVIKELEKIAKNKDCEKKQAIIYYFIQQLPKEEFSLGVLSSELKKNYIASDEATRKTITHFVREQNSIGQAANSYGYGRTRHYENDYSQINGDELFSESTLRTFFAKVEPKELGSYSGKSEIFKKK